jgi:hypothetical protein
MGWGGNKKVQRLFVYGGDRERNLLICRRDRRIDATQRLVFFRPRRKWTNDGGGVGVWLSLLDWEDGEIKWLMPVIPTEWDDWRFRYGEKGKFPYWFGFGMDLTGFGVRKVRCPQWKSDGGERSKCLPSLESKAENGGGLVWRMPVSHNG